MALRGERRLLVVAAGEHEQAGPAPRESRHPTHEPGDFRRLPRGNAYHPGVGEKTLTVDAASAAGYTVRDAMVKRPKTLPAEATVADLRRLFENPKVRTALIVDGERFRGAVERDDAATAADDGAPALSLASPGVPTVGPGDALPDALERLGRTAERRLVVVEADGRLAGLLCPNEDGTSFCLDPHSSS